MQFKDRDFRLLFYSNPMAMWVFDLETLQFLAVNDTAVSLYGYSRKEFETMTIEDIRFPEDCPALRLMLKRFQAEATISAWRMGKWRLRTKAGAVLLTDILWCPVSFHDRPSILASVIDFSEPRADTHEIQDRFTRLSLVVNDAFWNWDFEEKEKPDWNWWRDRIHPEDRARVIKGLEDRFLRGGDAWEDEYRYRSSDGTYSFVIDRGYIVRNDSGAPVRMMGTLTDITRRKEAETLVRLYNDIFLNIQIGLYVWRMLDINDDQSFQMIAANPASEKIIGIPSTELLGKSLDQCFPEVQSLGIPQTLAEVVRTGRDVQFANIAYGDHRVPFSRYTARFFPLPEQCVGIAFEDIAARLRAEENLRRIENRFQTLATMLPVGIFQNDSAGNCIYVNEKCCELCGTSREDLLGGNWVEILHPQDRKRVIDLWAKSVRERIPFRNEYRFKRPDGTIVWVLGQVVPEYDDSGEFAGFIGTITDVTDRKRLENEILSISSQEQQRIGQALHDRLGQHLTGVAFLAKAMAQQLRTYHSAEADSAEEIARLMNQAILRTRDLARMLHPVELEENGLFDAFQDLASNASRMFNISCKFFCDRNSEIQDHSVATHLYHIAQEAITNAVKHGRATSISVEIGKENGHSFLKVEDNGCGIAEGFQNSTGIGLKIMKSRVAMIDGDLQIRRSETGGTVLTCSFTKLPCGDSV